VLKWVMLKMVLRDVASCYALAWLLSLPLWGQCERAGLPLHRPMACIQQTRKQYFKSCAALSHHAEASSGGFSEDAKPLDSDICLSVDHLGPMSLSFYMGRVSFTRVSLPCGGVLVACMHIFLIELPFQTAIRRIPILEYMLLGVHGLLQACLVSPGNE
jgi:hypothetical protein